MLLSAAVPPETPDLFAIPSFPSLQPYWFIINDFSLSELFSSLVIFFDDLINLYNQIPPHLFKLPPFKGTADISL